MPAGLRRPTFAMKFWLALRFGRDGKRASKAAPSPATPDHPTIKAMHIESIEHIVRNRVRTFLRHTWLVTILGTIVLGGAVWAVVYFWTAPTEMRVAAGPDGSANVKVVQLLTQKFINENDRVRFHLVPTGGPKSS